MPKDEYEEYERACEEIRTENANLLADFERWLSDKGLSDKTIRSHAENVNFYVNTYLLYEDAVPARDGASHASMFLGYWFIRKAMWASPSSIRENAASLKKFYTFMHEKGHTDADDLQDLKQSIKDEMPEWLASIARYDDPDVTDPMEIWGF